MASLPARLGARIRAATGLDPELRPATKPQFGHFQSNVALRLGKERGRNPREVAAEIVARLDVAGLCEPPEIAGPGFLNFRLTRDVLAEAVNETLDDTAHDGIAPVPAPQRVVVDYSSPNVAKQMHVGHLRTTIIGDCFARVLRAVGDEVIPQNHLGDWGRQFGMLIEQIREEDLDLDKLDLAGAEELYKRANAHLEADPDFADRARARVVALQGADEATRAVWRRLIAISMAGFNRTYARLGVLLTDDDLAGESMYNAMLDGICDDLQSRGIAVVDDGALIVRAEGFDAPAILRNSAGGYGYDVTDVAAVKHRVENLGATRLVYVTDARQAGHFALVFAVARRAGYLPDGVSAEHVGYGMVLGPDGRPFRTRDGLAAHLDDLLDEAEQISSPEVALAAIKYADLSNQLQKDYVFDPSRMTQTTGDTGPYLQYAHARVSQILRRALAEEEHGDGSGVPGDGAEMEQRNRPHVPGGRGVDCGDGSGGPGVPEPRAAWRVTRLDESAEQDLALWLTRFGEAVDEVATKLTPHKLCIYLYELAGKLSVFYEQCPVLKSEGEVRTSRLALCAATQVVLARGLSLLGIPAPERM